MTKRFPVLHTRLTSHPLIALTVVAAIAVTSCGRQDDEAFDSSYQHTTIPRAQPERLALNDLSTGLYPMASGADAVSLENCTEKIAHTVTPAGVPTEGTRVDNIEVKMCLRLNGESSPNFVKNNYATGKWGLRIVKPGTGAPEKIDYKFFTTTDATYKLTDQTSASTNSRNGFVSFTINFSGKNELETKAILDKWTQTVDGRKKITFQPFFYVGASETPDESPANMVKSDSILVSMKTDIGVIRNAIDMNKSAQPSGSRLTFTWASPSDLSSDDYSSGKAVPTNETSSVESVLLIYWSDEECKNGGWDFKTNDQVSAKVQTLSCSYPTDMQTSCATTISSGTCTGEGEAIAEQSPQNFIVPNITTLPGVGETIKVGCYRVTRASGANSRNVANLENGKLYGAMAWPIDSSGHIGAKRSQCAFGTPNEVPLGVDEKSDIPNSKDCFVVTAASGNANSRAVYYWRAVRDTFLEGSSFKRWYLQNGPFLATWLNQHASLKSPIEAVLAVSGWAIIEGHDASQALRKTLSNKLSSFFKSVSQFIFPVAQAAETSAPAPAPYVAEQWTGSSWTNISFTGGIIKTTKDKEYYDAYYKSQLTRFSASQTFRLVDLSGELGLGYGFSYSSRSGNVPDKKVVGDAEIKTEIQGKVVSFYSLGAFAIAEYRYRVGVTPYLWPRLTVGGGVERTRYEGSMPDDFDRKDGEWDPDGKTVYAPLIFTRLAVEFSLSELGIGDRQALSDGYGANEFALALYGEYISDLSSKRLSLSGLGFGAGISLLLP